MSSVLIAEWVEIIADAAKFVQPMLPYASVKTRKHALEVSAGHTSVYIRLVGLPFDALCMAPEIHIGGSTTLPSDPAAALGVIEIQREAITAVLKVPAIMSRRRGWPTRIYLRDMPCPYCSARGHCQGEICHKCSGEGVLNTTDEANQ